MIASSCVIITPMLLAAFALRQKESAFDLLSMRIVEVFGRCDNVASKSDRVEF